MTLSGADVGFQIDGHRSDTPVGHVVLRIDGEWVDAQIGGNGTTRIASR